MKETTPDFLESRKMNAAENNTSSISVAAPSFNPTVQLKESPVQMSKEEEEEESLQAKFAPFQFKGEEEEESLQAKFAPFQFKEEEEESMQLKEGYGSETQSSQQSTPTQLPEAVQTKMESTMGADFSGVNVHKESEKATSMGALAFAQGNDVHFAPGQYNPQTQSGQELIGHELAHVVQQKEGRVSSTTQMKGQNVNDDPVLEREADEMGNAAAKKKELI